MDGVKPSYDVSLRTAEYRRGGRRYRETQAGEDKGGPGAGLSEDRRDELRYPRDYTAAFTLPRDSGYDGEEERGYEGPTARPAYRDYLDDDSGADSVPAGRDDFAGVLDLLAKTRSKLHSLSEETAAEFRSYVTQPPRVSAGGYGGVGRGVAGGEPSYVSKYVPLADRYADIYTSSASNSNIGQKIADSQREIGQFDSYIESHYGKAGRIRAGDGDGGEGGGTGEDDQVTSMPAARRAQFAVFE